MNTTRKHGGPRKGAGRKVRLNLHFEYDDAHTIYRLTRILRANSGNKELTEEQMLLELAEEKWKEIERGYEEAAQLAAEGEAYIL